MTKTRQAQMSAYQSGKFFLKILTVGLVLTYASCITVNVNFPESAVQRAADDFVQDLYKGADKMKNKDPESGEMKTNKKSKGKDTHKTEGAQNGSVKINALPLLFSSLLIAQAHAASGDLISPTGVDGIRSSMEARLPKLEHWKKSGAVCQSRDGMLDLADPSKTEGKAAEVKALVNAENKDRETLFAAYEQANNIKTDSNKSRMREIFSESFLKKSPYPCK